MTDHLPGRIYSGIVNGERVLLLRRRDTATESWRSLRTRYDDLRTAAEVTDVRGPLVVLDMQHTYTPSLVEFLRSGSYDDVADQIDEQAVPPLQVGVHVVRRGYNEITYLRWDGRSWRTAGGARSEYHDWVSVYFVGPGTTDLPS